MFNIHGDRLRATNIIPAIIKPIATLTSIVMAVGPVPRADIAAGRQLRRLVLAAYRRDVQ